VSETYADIFDVFVVGGGINGCGIAREAVGRGFSVCLAEMNDLASGTSSGSTKLVHGGLRYLEYYEFRLVREALKEREVLWSIAPHIIWPLRFVLPHHKELRPAWFLRLGLFLYDHLGGRKLLPGTKVLNMADDEASKPLSQNFSKAFEYSDCWVNDARLVVLNARDAADRGAQILVRTKVVSAVRCDGLWQIVLEGADGARKTVNARYLINAAGPWVDQFLADGVRQDSVHNVRLVQGSHIIVKKLFDHDRCYIFQQGDGRIVFAIPYEDDFTLIGTTDREFSGDPTNVKISSEEIDYLCGAANEYFSQSIEAGDVVWSYSAIRPLFDDGASKAQEATRDYVLKVEGEDGQAPLLNIFGGKITTYRKLSESAVEKIESFFGERQGFSTNSVPLPGGDFEVTGFDIQVQSLKNKYPFLQNEHARHLVRHYGTKAYEILGKARSYDDLGEFFGGQLWACEVAYLVSREWALSAEDILWRRTKQGLRMKPGQVEALELFLQNLDARAERLSA